MEEESKHGCVYYIKNCHDCEKYNQEKFFIPVYVEAIKEYGTVGYQWWGFYINSYPQNLENLKYCDVLVEQTEHSFIKQDSWINVDRIHRYPDSLLTVKVGEISNSCKNCILEAVQACRVLERKHKKETLSQFANYS